MKDDFIEIQSSLKKIKEAWPLLSIDPSISLDVAVLDELVKGALGDKELLSDKDAVLEFPGPYVSADGRYAASEDLGHLRSCEQFFLHMLLSFQKCKGT